MSASVAHTRYAPFSIAPILSDEEEWQFRDYINGIGKRGPKQSQASQYVTQCIETLGERYCQALFTAHAELGHWLLARISAGHGRLVIVSDEAPVLRELWETLRTAHRKPLVLQGISIERRLPGIAARPHLRSKVSKLRVLWVAPRPRSLPTAGGAAGKERILNSSDEIALSICSPPTLAQLMKELRTARALNRPFQIVHFAGEGAFLAQQGGGVLFFETEHGDADPVAGDRLRLAFQDVPLVLLEACSAAGIWPSEPSWEAVVPHLLHHGVQSVIAVPYWVHVDQMACFLPTFYRALSASRTVGQAVLAGREALIVNPSRRTTAEAGTDVELLDWWTLQLYQQGRDVNLRVSNRAFWNRKSAVCVVSAAASQPADSTFFSRYRLAALCVLCALLGLSATLLWHHIRAAKFRANLDAEKNQMKDEIKSCLESCLSCRSAQSAIAKTKSKRKSASLKTPARCN